ncbi:MAG TPA: GNAT family N-acetyltransferase [Dehalococcoidia bacterium]|nr:GNAT family N-acetyltransferase [Dehalococcoidia bacterium]
MPSPVEHAIAVDAANFALGNESFELLGATFVRNTAIPDIYDANHVQFARPTTPDEIEAFLVAVEREYTHAGHRRFDVDFRTPPEFAARLAVEGYERDDGLILLLEGPLIGTAPQYDIRPIESEADWEAYWELMIEDWREHHRRTKRKAADEVARRMYQAHRLKVPPVRYFMAYVKEKPVAYFNSWEGIDGVGQVDDLYTQPKHRKKGIATALIHHCVAEARARGAKQVVIAADPTDTPKQIYFRIGWRPVAIVSHYLKRLDS